MVGQEMTNETVRRIVFPHPIAPYLKYNFAIS